MPMPSTITQYSIGQAELTAHRNREPHAKKAGGGRGDRTWTLYGAPNRPTEEEEERQIVPATSAATATQSRAGPRRRRSDASPPGPLRGPPERNEIRGRNQSTGTKIGGEEIAGLGDRRRKRPVSSPAHWDRAGLGFARAD